MTEVSLKYMMNRISGQTEEYNKNMVAGGSASNTLNAVARLGVPAGFVGKIGSDRVGEFYQADARANGIDPLLFSSENESGRCMLSDVYAGSKYANRMPIGLMEVVDNFQPNVLRDYYHKWYRPDLQALVIVGDIDVDATEQKIKEVFADIPKPVNPAERVYFPVPDNQEPIVSIATDKENPSTTILVFFKRDVVPAEQKKGMHIL